MVTAFTPTSLLPRRGRPRAALALLLAATVAVVVAPTLARAADGPEVPGPIPPAAPARGAAPGEEPAALRAALAELPSRSLLRVFLAAGSTLTGRLAEARADTLWLRPDARARGAASAAWPVSISDIVRLERRAGSGEAGAAIGAAVFGLLGGLAGAALADLANSFGDGDDGDADVLGGAAMGLAAGAGVGGILGAGLGSLGRHWEVVYPRGREAARPAAAAADTARGAPSRLVVEAGWARGRGNGQDDSGATLALGLLTRRGPRFEYGPVVRYYAVDGMPEQPGPNREPSGVQPGGSFLLEGRLQSARAGWRPWLDLGAGIVLTDDIHPGGQLGVGLRRRGAHGLEWGVAARRTVITGDSAAFDGVWSLTAGAAFRP